MRFRFQVGLMFALTIALTSQLLSAKQPNSSRLITKRVVTFGDSLTDNDLLFLFFPGGPRETYGTDPIEAFFNKASRPSDQLTNVAVAGVPTSEIRLQVQNYVAARRAGELPPATLLSLQGGGNDFLDILNNSQNLFLLASAAPGESELADAVIQNLRRNLLVSYIQLRLVDPKAKLVLWTVPDITLTPFVLNPALGFTGENFANLRAHLAPVNRMIRLLSIFDDSLLIDADRLLIEFTFQPPVIQGTTIVPTPVFGASTFQFADPIHPTGVVNALVANRLIQQVNERYGTSIETYSEAELAALAEIE